MRVFSNSVSGFYQTDRAPIRYNFISKESPTYPALIYHPSWNSQQTAPTALIHSSRLTSQLCQTRHGPQPRNFPNLFNLFSPNNLCSLFSLTVNYGWMGLLENRSAIPLHGESTCSESTPIARSNTMRRILFGLMLVGITSVLTGCQSTSGSSSASASANTGFCARLKNMFSPSHNSQPPLAAAPVYPAPVYAAGPAYTAPVAAAGYASPIYSAPQTYAAPAPMAISGGACPPGCMPASAPACPPGCMPAPQG